MQELAADFCRCERLARAARRAHAQAVLGFGLSHAGFVWLEDSSANHNNNLIFLVSYIYAYLYNSIHILRSFLYGGLLSHGGAPLYHPVVMDDHDLVLKHGDLGIAYDLRSPHIIVD